MSLHLSVYQEDIETLAELLSTPGINVNALDGVRRETPLHIAARSSSTIVARILLEHGADLTITNKYGATPFCEAVTMGSVKTVALLLDYGSQIDEQNPPRSGNTMLHISVNARRIDLVKVLLQNGISTRIQNVNGDTPLHISSRSSQSEIVMELLTYGADPNIRNKEGKTCHDVAHIEVRDLLYYSNLPTIKEPM